MRNRNPDLHFAAADVNYVSTIILSKVTVLREIELKTSCLRMCKFCCDDAVRELQGPVQARETTLVRHLTHR